SAQPSTVVRACATSLSSSGADDAITADSPRTTAGTASKTESIVRLLRRPGSVFVRRLTFHERSADTACSSRLTPVAAQAGLRRRRPGRSRALTGDSPQRLRRRDEVVRARERPREAGERIGGAAAHAGHALQHRGERAL